MSKKEMKKETDYADYVYRTIRYRTEDEDTGDTEMYTLRYLIPPEVYAAFKERLDDKNSHDAALVADITRKNEDESNRIAILHDSPEGGMAYGQKLITQTYDPETEEFYNEFYYTYQHMQYGELTNGAEGDFAEKHIAITRPMGMKVVRIDGWNFKNGHPFNDNSATAPIKNAHKVRVEIYNNSSDVLEAQTASGTSLLKDNANFPDFVLKNKRLIPAPEVK